MSRSPAFEPTRELPKGAPVPRVEPAKPAKPPKRRGGAVMGSGLVMLGFGGGLAIGGGLLLVSLGVLGVALWASPSGTEPVAMPPAPAEVAAASGAADAMAEAEAAAASGAAAKAPQAPPSAVASAKAPTPSAGAAEGAPGDDRAGGDEPPGGQGGDDPSVAAPALAASGTADEAPGWTDNFSDAVRGIGVAVGLIDDTEIVPPTGDRLAGEDEDWGVDDEGYPDRRGSDPDVDRVLAEADAVRRRAPQRGGAGGAAASMGTTEADPSGDPTALDDDDGTADALIADLIADRDDPAAVAMAQLGTADDAPIAAAPGLVGGAPPPVADLDAPGGEFAMPAGTTSAGADRVDDLPTRGGWAESAMSLVDAGMRLMTGSAATDRAPVAAGTPALGVAAPSVAGGAGGADLLQGDDEDWGFDGEGTRPGEGEPDPEVLAMLAEADAVGRAAPPTPAAASDDDEWAAFDAVADAVGLAEPDPVMALGTGDVLDELVAGLGIDRTPEGDAAQEPGAPATDLLADDDIGGFDADDALLEDTEGKAEIMAMLAEADAVPREVAPPPPAQPPPDLGDSSWADSARSLVSAGMSMMLGTSGSAPAPMVAPATSAGAPSGPAARDLLAGEDDLRFEADDELYEDDEMDGTVASILADADSVQRGAGPEFDDAPMTEDEWTAPIPGIGRGVASDQAATLASTPAVDDALAVDAGDADELLAALLSERDEFDVAPGPMGSSSEGSSSLSELAMASTPDAESDWDDGAAAVVDTGAAAPPELAPPPPPAPKKKPEDIGSGGWADAASGLVRSGMAMMTGNSESAGTGGGGPSCVGELCEDDDLVNYRDGQASGGPIVGSEDYDGLEVGSESSDVADLFNIPGGGDETDAGTLADLDTFVVQINANVEGIEVRIDGALLGITPALVDVTPGWHVVQLGTGDTLRAEATVDPDEWCFESKGKNFKPVRCR